MNLDILFDNTQTLYASNIFVVANFPEIWMLPQLSSKISKTWVTQLNFQVETATFRLIVMKTSLSNNIFNVFLFARAANVN